jgi:hypothetical protein
LVSLSPLWRKRFECIHSQKSLWQWLINHTNIKLYEIRRFGNLLYFRLQVSGCHCAEKYATTSLTLVLAATVTFEPGALWILG